MRTVAAKIAGPSDLSGVIDGADPPDTGPDATRILLDSAIQIDQDAIAIDKHGCVGLADDLAAERVAHVLPFLANLIGHCDGTAGVRGSRSRAIRRCQRCGSVQSIEGRCVPGGNLILPRAEGIR